MAFVVGCAKLLSTYQKLSVWKCYFQSWRLCRWIPGYYSVEVCRCRTPAKYVLIVAYDTLWERSATKRMMTCSLAGSESDDWKRKCLNRWSSDCKCKMLITAVCCLPPLIKSKGQQYLLGNAMHWRSGRLGQWKQLQHLVTTIASLLCNCYVINSTPQSLRLWVQSHELANLTCSS